MKLIPEFLKCQEPMHQKRIKYKSRVVKKDIVGFSLTLLYFGICALSVHAFGVLLGRFHQAVLALLLGVCAISYDRYLCTLQFVWP